MIIEMDATNRQLLRRLLADLDRPVLTAATGPEALLVASRYPVAFFIGVLAGEEPIDHTQKQILRGSKQLPPVLARIMQIHVA